MRDDELQALLSKIRARPALFLGKDSISLLAAFLDGFFHGRGGQGQFDSDVFVGFQEFIRTRFNMSSSHRWNDVILFFETDEARAFWRFFELFDEYCGAGRSEAGADTRVIPDGPQRV